MGKVEDKDDPRGGAGAEEPADVNSPSTLQQNRSDNDVNLPSPPNVVLITPHSTTNTIVSAITTPHGLLGDEHTVPSAIVTTSRQSSPRRNKTPPTSDSSGAGSNAGPSTKPAPTIIALPNPSSEKAVVGKSSNNVASSTAAHAAKEKMYASKNNGGVKAEMKAEHPSEATIQMRRSR